MADSLTDIMINRDFSEPPEIRQIKKFVLKEIGITPEVKITPANYIISVPNAAAAGTLRMKLWHLQKELKDKRKAIIKITG